MARCRRRDRGDSGMGVMVQQRQTPLRLWKCPAIRIREHLENRPRPHYNYSGSASIVASNEPGAAQTAKNGRTLHLHKHDALLRGARADWATQPALRDNYRKHRPTVERVISQIASRD